MPDIEPPDDVLAAIRLVSRLRDKKMLTREEKIDINRAKLRVAYWACRSENVVASRDTLAYVLGNDAQDIMSAYDRYLDQDAGEKPEPESQRPARRKTTRRGGDNGRFWGDA